MKNTDHLIPDTYYHIYNRGNNSELLFKRRENYEYFLLKYEQYISLIADTMAYCLLGNHFHFLIHTRSEEDILRINSTNAKEMKKTASKQISLQFSHLFNGYTQAFNKQNSRTGKLFELPFRRVSIGDDTYLSRLIYYIHTNPERHGLVDDFRLYPWSSYLSLLSDKPTKLKRDQVLNWFGGKVEFLRFHEELRTDTQVSDKYFQDFDV